MSEEPATPTQGKKKDRSKINLVIILILLLGLAALLIWLVPKISHYKELVEEQEMQKAQMQKELDDFTIRYDSIKASYGTLSDSLLVMDSIIQANTKEIQNLLNYKWEYYKIDKKFKLLQDIAQDYVIKMDSLYTSNRELKEENELIKEQINTEKQLTQNLKEEKEELIQIVENAAVLQTYNLTATPIKIVGNKRREKYTDKANRVENIKVCFTIGANDLVEPGIKPVYVRIARPDNEIITQLTTDDYTFEYQGELIQYTIKKEIDYQNEPVDLCVYWRKRTKEIPAMIGEYHVYVFAEGVEIGHTTFELK